MKKANKDLVAIKLLVKQFQIIIDNTPRTYDFTEECREAAHKLLLQVNKTQEICLSPSLASPTRYGLREDFNLLTWLCTSDLPHIKHEPPLLPPDYNIIAFPGRKQLEGN